ncbi:MAG: glycosyltransferase [Ilumatobacteraceae bacterium]
MTEQPFTAFTIVAHNYMPRARLLADSFQRHHPESCFFTVVIDHPLKVLQRQLSDPSLVAITQIDFGPEGFEHMATGYDVTEFATAVKPFALRHFLQTSDCVLYLDPDIELYAPLHPIVASTRARGVSLTPHCLQPIRRDGCQPSEPGLLAAGVYNLGYVGVAQKSLAFVDWWAERLRRDALNDPANYIFTDQKWIDLSVPLFLPHIEIDPGYNVAYWNLDQRPITERQGTYYAGGSPLRFFHFSGYDPARRHWISKYQPAAPRVVLSEQPVLMALFNDYGDRLVRATIDEESLAYGWGEACPGVHLTADIRRAFHHDLRRHDDGLCDLPPSPFLPGGAQRFVDWVSHTPPDGLRPLPRYLHGVWEARPDVRLRMPETVEGDIARLRIWTRALGGATDPNIAVLGWRPEADERFGMVRTVGDTSTHGVNLVGYLHAELGIGEAARLAHLALRSAALPVTTVATQRTLNRQHHEFAVDARMEHDTVLMAVNADQFPQIHADLGPEFFRGRYTIGQWFWELAVFQRDADRSFPFVDEVWTATEFIHSAVAAAAPPRVIVTHMPLPLETPTIDPTLARPDFGLDERFLFLFSFDMMSVIDRKNPLGLIEAYRAAFAVGDGAGLVLKTMNGATNAEGMERLRWAAMGRPDIVVIDAALDRISTNTLTSLCDCYVSLHRSEGLGLTMAEAMLLERPVIATGYSGNMDFMNDATAHLVRWEEVGVPASARPYPTTSTWAEPDLGHAAALMRQVADDRAAARALGAGARRHLVEHHSAARSAAAMSQRLSQIWSK